MVSIQIIWSGTILGPEMKKLQWLAVAFTAMMMMSTAVLARTKLMIYSYQMKRAALRQPIRNQNEQQP